MGIIGFVLILVIVVLMTLTSGPGKPYLFWDTPSHIYLWGFLVAAFCSVGHRFAFLPGLCGPVRFPRKRQVRRFADGETLASSLFPEVV